MLRTIFPTSRLGLAVTFGLLTAAAALAPGSVPEASAQEPAACLSQDPADWPAPSKPYFMLAIDTSGSMTEAVGTNNSCGYPNDRNGHSRCAIRKSVLAFGGQVNFGLATFAVQQDDCDGTCYSGCRYFCTDGEIATRGVCVGCGPRPGNAASASGAEIVVPMQQDNFWTAPPTPSNVPTVLDWVNNACGNDAELFALGNTPLNGILRDMKRYFAGTYVSPFDGQALPSPLAPQDLSGEGVNGSTGCRSVNVILQTDGDETCDTQADAVAAAQDLYQNGVTVGGKTFRIRVHVINFQGGSQANTDAIAAAGGTGASLFATNEATLAQALSTIIAGSVSPEVCDNSDNNCNGCTDEGYRHYCNVGQDCCAWTTEAQRQQCLTSYQLSITAQDPDGDLTDLPCTTEAQSDTPASWLCFNPGETCDELDNNCVDGDNEGVLQCGDPLHCPEPEVCNGLDDDCNGVPDNGLNCPSCVPGPEQCNGCDDDCNGIVDDGAPPQACGNPDNPACTGEAACQTVQANVPPGSCQGPVLFGDCSAAGSPETCNDVDDDCDGLVDDGVPPQACVPPDAPQGLVFGPDSQCQQGQQACAGDGTFGPCIGYQGPGVEVCDGVDNDCDGVIDDSPSGVGQPCGVDTGTCSAGTTACVNGALECSGGVGPSPESCNGDDDDCDGAVDEAPLADAPQPNQNGCWDLPGDCCEFQGFTWCPPAGGACGGLGTLTAPCSAGTLACVGGAWACTNSNEPSGEVCDGLDNDCDGAVDVGDFPGENEACGTDEGECTPGTTQCTNGFLDCVGDTAPVEEVCNGLDDDCDGTVDDGIVVGGTCIPDYDEEAYPGDRIFPSGTCQLGALVCDPDSGGAGTRCEGGSGPQPEICDGLDNDCDGEADEVGPAPDGIDGTTNPDDPTQTLGDPCGVDEGLCAGGALGCVNGRFECVGGQEPQPEACDCEDNDCDGTSDNQNPGNDPPLCSAGKDCVKTAQGCQCAAPCGSGEFPCPSGQTCQTVTSSETGEEIGSFCVAEFCPGGCADKTFTDADGVVRCAPAGTLLDDCRTVPECECNGQNGCVGPCFGVTCSGSTVCARFGPQAGTCVPDSCFNVGCQGCDVFCGEDGECIGNPCAADDACAADEVCVPSPDGASFTCKPSCADVDCESGQVCKDGACVDDCDPACGADEVCDHTQTPAQCVESQCDEESCPAGGCCDPLTGACGACPCEGVSCPDGQVCVEDECVMPGGSGSGGEGGAGATTATATGAGGEGAASATSATGATSASGSGGSDGTTGGVFGLTTGGGGCQCELGAGSDGGGLGRAAAALVVGLAAALRRRRRAQPAAATRKEVA
jgi:hypothetical protein